MELILPTSIVVGPTMREYTRTQNIYFPYNPPFYESYGGEYALWRRIVNRPSAVKRTKPVGRDLIWNGTSWSREEDLSTWSSVTEVNGHVMSILSMQNRASAGSWGPTADVPDMTAKLHQAVRDQKVNLAMALAEYRQTASLFQDLGTRVAGAWKSLRRGRPRDFYRSLVGRSRTEFSANWLQFQYGVRPLYLDMIGSIKALEEAAIVRPPLVKVVVRGRAVETNRSVSYPYGPNYPVSREGDFTVRKRWTLYYTCDNAYIKNASALGFTNPVALAWELVPYSFVIDWFINVGDWLEQIDVLSGIDRIALYKGTKTILNAKAKYRGGLSTYRRETLSRTAPQAFPKVQLQYEPSLSWQRITSGLALLRQSRS